MKATGAVIRHPECDIRPWLKDNEGSVSPYTVQRITQSYLFIDDLLSRHEGMGAASAFDVGCGAGFDTFAIGRHFDHVLAIDRDRRAIREARVIAKGAGVSHVTFEKANIESSHGKREFDFVYCNLMSHNVSSRCALLSRLRRAMKPGSCLLYSEHTEGYPPMEIHRAIVARDQVQLVSRIWQVLRGFTGQSGFRFFLAGTAQSLLEASQLSVVTHEFQNWNGMRIIERMTARAESGAPGRSPDADYLDTHADFAQVRTQFKEMLSARPRSGYSSSQRSRIESLSESGGNRYAPFLLFLLMADLALPSFCANRSSLGRTIEVWQRIARRLGSGLGHWTPRTSLDWGALEDLDSRFIRAMRRSWGLPTDSIVD